MTVFDAFIEKLKGLDEDQDPEWFLEELDDNSFEIVSNESGVWESRWGIGHEIVLQFAPEKPQLLSRYLKITFERGATEGQEDHPPQTDWFEVYPVEKTVTVYEAKKHDNTKIETTTIPLF